MLLRGDAVRSGAGFLLLWGHGLSLRGAVCSGAGFLVLWLVEREMLPTLGWIFVGVWVVAQGRCCPFGGGFPGVVVGEGGSSAHLGVDIRRGVA